MKTLLAILILGASLFTTPSAEASHSRNSSTSCAPVRTCGTNYSSCRSCGGRIYYVKVFVGYDCRGCPVYRWVAQRHTCPPPPTCGHGRPYWHRQFYFSRPGFSIRICR